MNYYPELKYFGMKFIDNAQTVEDIVIEAIINVSKANYENKRNALYVAVKNKCMDECKRIKRRRFTELEDDIPDIENGQLEFDVISKLSESMRLLPKESRTVIDLYYIKGKKCVEIAKILNKPVSTVRSIKQYALGRLRNILTKSGKPSGAEQP